MAFCGGKVVFTVADRTKSLSAGGTMGIYGYLRGRRRYCRGTWGRSVSCGIVLRHPLFQSSYSNGDHHQYNEKSCNNDQNNPSDGIHGCTPNLSLMNLLCRLVCTPACIFEKIHKISLSCFLSRCNEKWKKIQDFSFGIYYIPSKKGEALGREGLRSVVL